VGELGVIETPSYHPDPADLHNPAIEPICKKYLELRYQLLPYIYSAAKETCETGLPMMRALWLHYPDDAIAVARGDEYLFGRDILVAPVVEKGATSRTLYLPQGVWYDFWTREKMQGGREITRNVELETTPLYVRAGAIMPLGPVKQYSGQSIAEPIALHVHPGANGTFSLYEDDGKTFNFRKGEFMEVEMKWQDADRRLNLSLGRDSTMLAPGTRTFSVQIAGESQKKEVIFEGKPVAIKL
jgi:alpha-glucosidase/alpha-D-xyloside xylohydrolase